MPCANESVLIPLQTASQWATPTDPITEEAIWVRADDACRLAEAFIARAVAGDPAMLLGIPQPWWITAGHRVGRVDAWLWDLFAAPFRWVRRRAVA
jgi:hypothetical protein